MKLRVVVIGANAAGAKAASKAKRMNPHAEVTLIERGNFISYGACGIPYFVSDTVADVKELMSTPVGVVRDAAFFNKVKGVHVITGTEVVSLDRQSRTVQLFEKESAKAFSLEYDRLVLATGSSPSLPPLKNRDLGNILTVKAIEDAELLKERAVTGKRACIVGGGLIGLETAEALRQKGLEVTIVEMRDQLLPGILDPEMASLVERHIRQNGVEVETSCRVAGFDGTGVVNKVLTERGEIPADVVVLAPGVTPNVKLAKEAGLEIGPTGAIAVDSRMGTSDPAIYACGDCCETTHLVTGKKVHVPLGSTANKQGRVAGINASGGEATFAGILGTSILRVFSVNAGKTGLTESEARAQGYDVETVLSPAPDKAHFFPGAKPIALKLVADRATGRILGLQAVGEGAVDKRVDAAAAAITFGATADQLSHLDLAYAPPYSAAMDNLIVAADILKNKLAGHARGISPRKVRQMLDDGDDFILLDVRSPAEHAEVGIEGATLIPLGALREKLESLPKDKEIVTFCKISLRGYEAQKILDAAGFRDVKFLDGGIMTWPYELRRGGGA
ncbi:FAD-dependent pyridine nucleotide-disulfide oxidoreductase [Geobacter metallireducens RCH3]|uniref:FAD-dependent pyridine nucleotide-disulfide oxidoreductase family protein, rhodanese homology domain-containing n=1 Tax=Geobacter metallireducens (strain ATCC 53774 / DSM 7210 / GS-15) TaxID=269799 RepID=Q39PY5_GEOMG|nr:FAD-dependent oxidoreductase [Geobacter metallireducens]ABB33689.1 FAD-dependent pyridine nucleotide-disulfide oxidoreductase family protein, rhodanese homology domain-containing [Geobacter metallireducens GS-15]EHP85790.1 FAD-dependent pyridine nucleotide-disulfide oxidoreductase [Geobacter metallireducens RCH3]